MSTVIYESVNILNKEWQVGTFPMTFENAFDTPSKELLIIYYHNQLATPLERGGDTQALALVVNVRSGPKLLLGSLMELVLVQLFSLYSNDIFTDIDCLYTTALSTLTLEIQWAH